MKLYGMRAFWVTDFGWPDVSFGIHVCRAGRVDFHFLKWMVSVGRVPLYLNHKGEKLAVCNSFHDKQVVLGSQIRARSLP